MIVYSANKSEFIEDVFSNQIEKKILDKFREALGYSPSPNEIESWRNSMQYMHNVLNHESIASDAGVSIEYRIPQTAKCIDFVLTGEDAERTNIAVIVELKQWANVEATDKDGIVRTFVGGGEREVTHPSYQAWTYAALLEDFNEAIDSDAIRLVPCAYLHNCESDFGVKHPFYSEHLRRAPAFLRKDVETLQNFIKQHIKYGDAAKIMYRIERGRIRPSKNLANMLVSLLKGKQEFLMIDDQKLVYETALQLAAGADSNKKNVLIVSGGPGTGKSVVAVNLLVEATRRGWLAQYVTKNAAPRAVYESKLTGSLTKTRITNLFKGSGAYVETPANTFDTLIVDEAHRLNEKSGMYQHLGENQIKEIIGATKFSVFFIDEDQRVTFRDIGEKEEIRRWADHAGANVYELALESQFRCNGSDGYLAWIDNVLQVRQTANGSLEGIDYDFRVFDSPTELRDAIFTKNQINNKARLVAGYCWDWVSKKKGNALARDIVFPEHDFAMKWNLDSHGSLWILQPESVTEVGCIHTCQGLEIDYVGVIIGPDLVVRGGKVVTDATKRAKTDSSIKGYKKMLRTHPEAARGKADRIIKNTYRTLMTRGAKGCYLYCTDRETREWFMHAIGNRAPHVNSKRFEGLPWRLLETDEVKPFENAVPVYDLKVAAGRFSDEQPVNEANIVGSIDVSAHDWAELPDTYRPSPRLFVAQVVGESMNRRIPNGAWCLFRLNPIGSRQGKVVLAQHRSIEDPDTGAQYTVKVYESDKVGSVDDTWRHTRIRLRPDTTSSGYEPIEFDEDAAAALRIIAEVVAVLG